MFSTRVKCDINSVYILFFLFSGEIPFVSSLRVHFGPFWLVLEAFFYFFCFFLLFFIDFVFPSELYGSAFRLACLFLVCCSLLSHFSLFFYLFLILLVCFILVSISFLGLTLEREQQQQTATNDASVSVCFFCIRRYFSALNHYRF